MPEHSRWAPRRRGLAYLILCAVLAAASGAGCLLAPAGSHLRSYLGGFAVGLGATTAVFLVLVVLDLRGHDSIFSREILGRDDERDKMVWLRSWSLTGVIGLISAIAGTAVPSSRAVWVAHTPVPFWPAASTITSTNGSPVAGSTRSRTSAVMSMR